MFDDGFDFLVVGRFVFRQTQHRRQLVVGLGLGPDDHEQHQQVHAVCGREQIAVGGIAQFLDWKNTKKKKTSAIIHAREVLSLFYFTRKK